MGAVPFWSVKDVLCLNFARTSDLRVVSRDKTSSKMLEGWLGGEKACAGVHKRTSSNGLSLSTIFFVVGVLRKVEIRIYPLSPLSSVLTARIL